MDTRKLVASIISLAAPSLAAAQISDALVERLEARTFRQETRVLELKAIPEPGAPKKFWDASVGAAYTDAQAGTRTWATPFVLTHSFNDDQTGLKFSGAGLVHAENAGTTKSGLADVTAALTQVLHAPPEGQDGFKLSGEVGLTVPTGGNVGSKNAKERIGATARVPLFDKWSAAASLKAIRNNGTLQPGIGRTSESALVQAAYKFSDDPKDPRKALVQFQRGYRGGVGGTNSLTGSYSWPLLGVVGALSYSRGLTSGSRDNTIEFDAGFKF